MYSRSYRLTGDTAAAAVLDLLVLLVTTEVPVLLATNTGY
jgi:hypothetical protein